MKTLVPFRRWKSKGLGLAILLLAPVANAVTTTAFPSLSLGFSARSQAMGEAFTGATDDLGSLDYNPAGLGLLRRESLAINHTSYLADGFFENGAAAFFLASRTTLALQAGYLNYGAFDQRDRTGMLIGTYTPVEYSGGVGLGFPLSSDWLGGVRTQWIQQDMEGNTATALAWNIGTIFIPADFCHLGASLKNLGVESTGTAIPSSFRLGAAFFIGLDSKMENRFLLDLDNALPFQGDDQLSIGLEYARQDKFFLRMGYFTPVQNLGPGTLNGWNMGAGLRIEPLELDYCFSFLGDLGNTQQISLVYQWGRLAGENGDEQAQSKSVSVTSPVETNNGPTTLNPVILKFQVKGEENLSSAELVAQGEVKESAGLLQEAQSLYFQAAQKDPNYKPAWAHLGHLSFKQSMSAYQEYLKLDPTNTSLKEWLEKYK